MKVEIIKPTSSFVGQRFKAKPDGKGYLVKTPQGKLYFNHWEVNVLQEKKNYFDNLSEEENFGTTLY